VKTGVAPVVSEENNGVNPFSFFISDIALDMPKKTYNSIRAKRALVSFFLVFGFLSSFLFTYRVEANGISAFKVIALTNTAREKEGLSPLVSNAKLAIAARDKAQDMLQNDYFAHTSPKGIEPWYWIKQAGYEYKYAGENLAINYTSAKEQQSAWMKSSTHRANILNTHYREIGVATVEGKIDGETSLVTVALFGTQMHVVADKSVSVTPPVVQPAEAIIPEVKGTEAIIAPLLIPLTEETAPVISNDASRALSQAQTYVQTLVAVLAQQVHRTQVLLSNVRWNEVTEMTAVAFLMLVVLMSPLAFLYQAVELIVQAVKERDMHRGEVSVPIVLSASPLGGIHQNMQSGAPLIRDIRPG